MLRVVLWRTKEIYHDPGDATGKERPKCGTSFRVVPNKESEETMKKRTRPMFSAYYRIIETKQVAEWVSATSPTGTFELKLRDGLILQFDRSEIEPITYKQYMNARKEYSN